MKNIYISSIAILFFLPQLTSAATPINDTDRINYLENLKKYLNTLIEKEPHLSGVKNQQLSNLRTMHFEVEQARRLLEMNQSGGVTIKHGQTVDTALAEMSNRAAKARAFTDKVMSLHPKQTSLITNQALSTAKALKNNPNAARATAAAVGTGTGVGVGAGTGTGLLAPVTGAGTLTVGAAVGAGLSTGLGIGCIYYERVYYNAVEKFNAACKYQLERPQQIKNRERNSWPTYQDDMNKAQIDMKTYGDLYNKCLTIGLFRDPVPTRPKCE